MIASNGRPLVAIAVLVQLAVTATIASAAGLCDLLSRPGAPGNPAEGQLKDAVVEQAKDLVWKSLEVAGGGLELGGAVGDVADDAVFGPISAYLTAPTAGENSATDDIDRSEAAIRDFMKGAAKITFPAVGVVVNGGNVVVSGFSFGIEEIWANAPPQGIALARGVDFYKMEPQWSRGITPQNIGEKVRTEDELHDLWFKTYAHKLKDFMPPAEHQDFLNQQWPVLLATWQRGRAAMVIRKFHDDLASPLAKAGTAVPGRGLFGLWRTPGGSILAITDEGDSVQAVFCLTGPAANAIGYRNGNRLYWGGKVSKAAAGEGRMVVNLHVEGRPQAGDCPRLAPKDLGPYSVRMEYNADADSLVVTEKAAKYHPTKCEWANVPNESDKRKLTRVNP